MFQKDVFQKHDFTLHYNVDLPAGFDPANTYPVLFYFHGMGGVAQGADYIAERGPLQRSRMPEDTPFILVVPACDDYTWMGHFSYIVDFIKEIASLPYVDDKRLCISGSSMGGYTCWMLAVMEPSLFAGAVICCGGGLYWAASRIKFPVRAVHGKLDPVVLPRESEIMATNINLTGGHCELILHDDLSHDVWTRTFTDHETYRWLYAQRRA